MAEVLQKQISRPASSKKFFSRFSAFFPFFPYFSRKFYKNIVFKNAGYNASRHQTHRYFISPSGNFKTKNSGGYDARDAAGQLQNF